MQSQDGSEPKSTGNISDPRKRIDERALEKEEEDYFNEDRFIFIFGTLSLFHYFADLFIFTINFDLVFSDEEDTASASMPRRQKTQLQPVRSNGVSPSSQPRYVLTL